MRARSLAAWVCVVAASIGWSASAEAFQGYPPVVDTWLGKAGLIETIEKPTGCQLCHVDPQGGTVQLRPFGNLLVSSYGLRKTAEEDPVLMGALAGLQAANPALFKDMQDGLDPNVDPALTSQELPQPEYGCSAARAGASRVPEWAATLVALVALSGGRRRVASPTKRDRQGP